MKRPRTIALLALLLALVGTAAVLCGIQDTMRHAAVTETTLLGDASAAEGVELCFGGTSDSKLSWEHRWRFGGSGTLDPAETDADCAQQNALHVQSTSFTCGNPQEQEAVALAWPDLRGCVDTGSLSSSLRFLWSNPIDPDNAALTVKNKRARPRGQSDALQYEATLRRKRRRSCKICSMRLTQGRRQRRRFACRICCGIIG